MKTVITISQILTLLTLTSAYFLPFEGDLIKKEVSLSNFDTTKFKPSTLKAIENKIEEKQISADVNAAIPDGYAGRGYSGDSQKISPEPCYNATVYSVSSP